MKSPVFASVAAGTAAGLLALALGSSPSRARADAGPASHQKTVAPSVSASLFRVALAAGDSSGGCVDVVVRVVGDPYTQVAVGSAAWGATRRTDGIQTFGMFRDSLSAPVTFMPPQPMLHGFCTVHDVRYVATGGDVSLTFDANVDTATQVVSFFLTATTTLPSPTTLVASFDVSNPCGASLTFD